MGNFLALSSIIGKTQDEVINSLANYTKSVNGGLIQEDNINSDTDNCCIIEESNGNTTILYPNGYLEWDDSSEFISKDLNSTVFSFHIHDGDLWMYILYHNGQIVDQFNPIPDYWDDNISEEEIKNWKGNASVIGQYISSAKTTDIENYFVRWNLEEIPRKAYPEDEFTNEEWQLVDFMNKLKLPYPIDDNGNPRGNTYKIWTKKLRLITNKEKTISRPWWKFWQH